MHLHNPLHRIKQWTGKYFISSWLWKVGVCIELGHGGEPCPCYQEGSVFPEQSVPGDTSDEEDDLEDPSGIDTGKPTSTQISGAKIMVIVHMNGIHYLPVRICRCQAAPTEDIQMMQLGYYPSTYKYIRTMFTFQLLDDYLLANLECQTSGHHYYQKLRRMTNKATPHLVPVSFHLASGSYLPTLNGAQNRYRELLRVSRQWRNLKEWKWFGFAHRKEIPGPAELALFCPTCPQPGINLPAAWDAEPREWLHWRSFVVDGNFVALHQFQARSVDDVWIKNGESFMTERQKYQQHIDCTVEKREVRIELDTVKFE